MLGHLQTDETDVEVSVVRFVVNGRSSLMGKEEMVGGWREEMGGARISLKPVCYTLISGVAANQVRRHLVSKVS